MNDKKIIDKMNKDENYRNDVLIDLNCTLQLAERITYTPSGKVSPQEYKLAVVSLEEENQELKDRIEKAIKYMDNTFNISSMKDFFEILNNIEEILKGDKE